MTTRILAACWPALWLFITLHIHNEDAAMFPRLPAEWVMPTMFGFMFSIIILVVVRIAIALMNGEKFP